MAISTEDRSERHLRKVGPNRYIGQRRFHLEGEATDPTPLIGVALESSNPPLPFVGDYFPKDESEAPLPKAIETVCQLREWNIDQHPKIQKDAILTALYDSGPNWNIDAAGNLPKPIWSEYTIEATEQMDFDLDGKRIPGGGSRFVRMVGIRAVLDGGVVTEAMHDDAFTVNAQSFLGRAEDLVLYKGLNPELISGTATSGVLETGPAAPQSQIILDFVFAPDGWKDKHPQLQGPEGAAPGEPVMGPGGIVFDTYRKYEATFFNMLFNGSGFRPWGV